MSSNQTSKQCSFAFNQSLFHQTRLLIKLLIYKFQKVFVKKDPMYGKQVIAFSILTKHWYTQPSLLEVVSKKKAWFRCPTHLVIFSHFREWRGVWKDSNLTTLMMLRNKRGRNCRPVLKMNINQFWNNGVTDWKKVSILENTLKWIRLFCKKLKNMAIKK